MITTGRVPNGATSVVQVATSGTRATTAQLFGLRESARITTRCPIARAGRNRTFTCTARLRAGAWTLTTRATVAGVVVAESVARVRVTAPARSARR